jgi:putative ABC transport system substrate-binding protein
LNDESANIPLETCMSGVINRRGFLGALAACVTSWARVTRGQTDPQFRVGWLSTGRHPFIEAFRQGMRELAYVEGQNLVIEERYAEGSPERLPALARELTSMNVRVVVTSGGPATRAAARAGPALPVVGVAGDLVAAGLVRSLAHPGGNVTGFNTLSPDLAVKGLEFFKSAVPKLARVAVLFDAAPDRQRQQVEATASRLGLQLVALEARDDAEIDRAFARAAREHVGGIAVVPSPLFAGRKQQIVGLAEKHRFPAMYEHRDFVEAGGLMSYGPDLREVFRRAAIYVDRILKGAKPAELPVEQPTKFELVINLKTAKALGLTIPPSLLQRVDQVIE